MSVETRSLLYVWSVLWIWKMAYTIIQNNSSISWSSVSPSSRAWLACASRLFLSSLWHSSRRCFWTLASSHRPASISRWSGRRRLSVGATPSSDSFRVRAKEEKKCMFSALSLESEGHKETNCQAKDTKQHKVELLDEITIREGVFLPQQLGLKSLINSLLFALRAAASLAAVHYFGALHLVVPCSWQDVMGRALSVLYHSGHLETAETVRHRKRWVTLLLTEGQ